MGDLFDVSQDNWQQGNVHVSETLHAGNAVQLVPGFAGPTLLRIDLATISAVLGSSDAWCRTTLWFGEPGEDVSTPWLTVAAKSTLITIEELEIGIPIVIGDAESNYTQQPFYYQGPYAVWVDFQAYSFETGDNSFGGAMISYSATILG